MSLAKSIETNFTPIYHARNMTPELLFLFENTIKKLWRRHIKRLWYQDTPS